MNQDPELQDILTAKPAAAPAPAPAQSSDDRKLAAFIPQERTIGGKWLAPYTIARRMILRRTGNELLRIRENGIAYAQRHGIDFDKLTDRDWLAAINEIADVDWHAVAFLFVLAADLKTLCAVSRDKEAFDAAVLAFADTLRGNERGIVPLVLDILVEAAAGNDYEVQSDGGPSPN